jgi:hypothetical protein
MALFRHSVVGDLLARELDHGELQDELKMKATRRYRPPGAPASRPYHWKTLQTWYLNARKGLDGLVSASRARGHALALEDAQRELLLDMRREHRSASTELILTEAVRNGAIPEEAVSEATLRRLYRDHDLGRDSQNRASRRERRRWQAERPCAIWHADVCHVWLRDADGKPRKAYVHGILDDHSRYVVALEARDAEREVDLLSVLCGALLRFPACDALYVDNGSCYLRLSTRDPSRTPDTRTRRVRGRSGWVSGRSARSRRPEPGRRVGSMGRRGGQGAAGTVIDP